MLTYNGSLKQNSRRLRANMTDAERRLWSKIRAHQLGLPFSRQKIIGPYIADFYCHQARLVIEVDGGQHFSEEAYQKDKKRDNYMGNKGLRVLRFSDTDVLTSIDGVVDTILVAISTPAKENPLDPPLPKGEDRH